MTSTAARIATTTLAGAAALLGLTLPASADSAVVTQDCDGVSVVVDFSDLGGAVESGCADGDPQTGREALEAAGFTPADGSVPGLVCTINDLPDPCPTEFEGSFWAYWQVVDGAWESSQVGFDEADPSPGDIEGWRYNDGSVPPPLPGAADAGDDEGPTSTGDASEEPSDVDENPSTGSSIDADASDDGSDSDGVSPALWGAIGVVVLAVVIGLVVRVSGGRAERAASEHAKE